MNIQEQLAHYGLSPDDVINMAGQIAADNFKREDRKAIRTPRTGVILFKAFLEGRKEEVFACAFLDTRHRLIKLDAN